jgi:cytochrome c biogenesis protein CcdA
MSALAVLSGLGGQVAVGLLLGAVWSPCVGPTLGAASVLAARAENLTNVALTMLAFGIGAALPLLAIGMMSREALMRWRSRLLAAGSGGKMLMGVLLVASGALPCRAIALLLQHARRYQLNRGAAAMTGDERDQFTART